ncbi:MAG TPA: hypothetical protein HA261_01155, partial [Methanosarcina sp.]|nr:hypothetical protein [Methanosarcina sp.]
MTPHMASAADEISGDNGSSGAVVSDTDSDSGDSSSGTDNSVTDDSTTEDSGTT